MRNRFLLALVLGSVSLPAARQSQQQVAAPFTLERILDGGPTSLVSKTSRPHLSRHGGPLPLESAGTGSEVAPVDWPMDNLASVGGHRVTVVGTPRVVATTVGPAIEFNGVSDGLVVDGNPIAGLGQFTIEVLFEPAADGPAEQRFFHIQEAGTQNRALLETRMLAGGAWCLDTFLRYGDASRTLIDRARRHPSGNWHVAALVFDGHEMAHYVNGEHELSGPVAFRPLGPGATAIGVRMNRVAWFKGRIARVRVTPSALAPTALMKVPRAGF